jgi:ribosomal protein S20
VAVKRTFTRRVRTGDNPSPLRLGKVSIERLLDRINYKLSVSDPAQQRITFKRSELAYLARMLKLLDTALDEAQRAQPQAVQLGQKIDKRLASLSGLKTAERKLQLKYRTKYRTLLKKFLSSKTEMQREEVLELLAEVDPETNLLREEIHRRQKAPEQTTKPSRTKS